MSERKTKCPDRAGHCSHDLIEHTAKGGCAHRGPRGQVCGCTYTTGPEQGASPFGAVGDFPAVIAAHPAAPVATTPKENTRMTAIRLFNIAGVATELNVTPQAASAWHRGPEKTPEPSFVVDATGLELWTADDVTAWSDWVEKREQAAKDAKAAKAAGKATPAPEMPKAEDTESVDTPDEPILDHADDGTIVDTGEVAPAAPSGRKSKTA